MTLVIHIYLITKRYVPHNGHFDGMIIPKGEYYLNLSLDKVFSCSFFILGETTEFIYLHRGTALFLVPTI